MFDGLTLPPFPTAGAAHVLVVHFPIVLILIAPLFLAVGLVSRRLALRFMLVSLVVTLAGTAAIFAARETGEWAEHAASEAGTISDAAEAVLHHHEELSGRAFAAAGIVCLLLLAGTIVVAMRGAKMPRATLVTIQVALLLAFVPAALLIANTAHLGGVLVHTHGVHATLEGAVVNKP